MSKGPSLKIRLFLYPLLAIIFALTSYIIVLNALGYNVAFKNFQLVKEKTGTIILATRPGDAAVYIDGKLNKSRTPAFNFMSIQAKRLKAGNHKVRIEKEGYETWEGNFLVEPGLVSWGTQVLLLAKSRVAQEFELTGDIVSSIQSPDKKHFLVKTLDKNNSAVIFWDFELNSKRKTKIFEKIILENESWLPLYYSANAERILFEQTLGEAKNYIVMENRETPKTWNLTESYQNNYDSLAFNPRNNNEIFAIKEGNLFKIELASKKVSAVLETKVQSIFVEENVLYLIQKDSKGNHLYRLNGSDQKKLVINSLPDSKNYTLNYLNSENGYALFCHDSGSVYSYKDSDNAYAEPKKLADKAEWMMKSPGGQFVGYWAGASYNLYDVEKNKNYKTITASTPKTIQWLGDQFNLIYAESDYVNMVTYNNDYKRSIFKADISFPVYADISSPRIYFFSQNEKTKKLDLFVYDFQT